MNAQALLVQLFESALAAVAPEAVLPAALPADTTRAARVVGAGKAAAAMAASLDRHWRGALCGKVITRHGHGLPAGRIEVIEAGHPLPDRAGQRAARDMLDFCLDAGAQDLVICLLSGGASALMCAPPPGVSLAQKAALCARLLRCGASIAQINCVRRHLSLIKGGRLAAAAYPAELLCLAISDAPRDDPAVIGSGPCVADPSTRHDALEVLLRYGIAVPPPIRAWLESEAAESLKPGDPRLARASMRIIANPARAIEAAARRARELGLEVQMLGSDLEGEARSLGRQHAALALRARQSGRRRVLLSGGESTVTLSGAGRGGRNTEYLLALFAGLGDAQGIAALAADTDGIDGSEDNAGAWFGESEAALARERGLDPARFLETNDSHAFFATLGTLLHTGPTRTNANDFRAILVEPDR